MREVVLDVTALTYASLEPKAKSLAARVFECDSSLLVAEQRGEAVVDVEDFRNGTGTVTQTRTSVRATFTVWWPR